MIFYNLAAYSSSIIFLYVISITLLRNLSLYKFSSILAKKLIFVFDYKETFGRSLAKTNHRDSQAISFEQF